MDMTFRNFISRENEITDLVTTDEKRAFGKDESGGA